MSLFSNCGLTILVPDNLGHIGSETPETGAWTVIQCGRWIRFISVGPLTRGLHNHCRRISNAREIARRYGISQDDWGAV